MSIASELTRLQSAKASIKSAIEEKLGNDVPSDITLSEYSTYVSSAADIQYALGVAAGAGGGEVVPVNGVTISNGFLEIKSGNIGNITVLNSAVFQVNSSSVVSNINVSSCASTYEDMEGRYYYSGMKVLSGSVASNVVVHSGGCVSTYASGTLVSPVVSSGGIAIFSSANGEYIELKQGGSVFVYYGYDWPESSSITSDYNGNGCNITFSCPPKVTVNYIGAGTSYIVSGITYPSGLNGRYVMYNNDPNTYKHVSQNYYLRYSDMYGSVYMMTANPDANESYDSYFYSNTSFTSGWQNSGNYGDVSGTPVVTQSVVTPVGAWSIDNGANWNNFGSSVFTGDAKGSLPTRTITFSSVTGYTAPNSITSTMYDRNNVFEVQYYLQLTVTITNAPGAQWSIDGGTTWNNSGASVQVGAGSTQVITYKPVTIDGTSYTHESQSISVTTSTNNVSVAYIANPGSGTVADPYLWSAKVDNTIGNTPGCHTIQFSAEGRDESQAIYLKVYLTSGTAYSFGADSGSDPYIYLKTLSGSTINSDDDGGARVSIDGHQLSAENDSYCSYISYTPSESGYYLIGGANSEGSTIRLHCYPAPMLSESNSGSGSSSSSGGSSGGSGESLIVSNADINGYDGTYTYDSATDSYVSSSGHIIHYNNGYWLFKAPNWEELGEWYMISDSNHDVSNIIGTHSWSLNMNPVETLTTTISISSGSGGGASSNSESGGAGQSNTIVVSFATNNAFSGTYTYNSNNNQYERTDNEVTYTLKYYGSSATPNWSFESSDIEGNWIYYETSDSTINGITGTHTWTGDGALFWGDSFTVTITASGSSGDSGGSGGDGYVTFENTDHDSGTITLINQNDNSITYTDDIDANGSVTFTVPEGTYDVVYGGDASIKGGDSTVTVTAGQTTNATCYFCCLVEGTKIRLANGKDKNVEDIEYDDELLVWDFDNGCYASAKPIWIKKEEIADEYLLSTYSNGIQLKTVGTGKHHEAFDLDNQEFNYIDDIVGHSVATLDGVAKCLSCKIVKENVKFYNVITDGHFNLYANGILTSCSLNKLYKVKDMTYVKDARNLASREEYDGIPEGYVTGLRLLEQPTNKKKYVERLINNEKQH